MTAPDVLTDPLDALPAAPDERAQVAAYLAAAQECPAECPAPCEPRVFADGVPVVVVAGPRMWMLEAWVREVARRCGLPVDWSFCGGRAVVRALVASAEERAAVVRALRETIPALRRAADAAHLRGDPGAYPVRGMWP